MPARLRLLFFALILAAGPAGADTVVVMNARSGVERLSRDEVINIFLGRYRRLPTGSTALPVDQPEQGGLKAEFYRRLVNKDLNEIQAYWARLIFSGKTPPPRQAASAAEVLALLASDPGAVGYLDRAQVNGRVRIVLDLSR